MEGLNLTPLFVVIVFAILNESIIEYSLGSIDILKPYLPLLGLTTAILLTFMYQINVFNLLLGFQSTSPFLDFLLSGFIISRSSNFINDFVRKVLGSK